MKKILTSILVATALLLPAVVSAQVFSQSQVILPPYGSNGFIVSTTTANGGKLQATSTPFFQNFFFGSATGTKAVVTTLCLSTDCRTVWPTATTPGGLNAQLQYNNVGVFGGITGATTDGTAVSLNAAHLLNPTINGAGVGLATLVYPNTASNATITFPTVTGTLATLAGSEALTNKSVNGVTLTAAGSATTYLDGTGAYSTPPAATFGTTSINATGPLNWNTTTATMSITQSGSGTNGYLSSTDWNTFNNKQPAGTYVTSIAVATANGLAGSSSGGATPTLTLSTTINGLLKGNATAISAAANGTDYTLVTANTCGAGQFFNSATAAGIFGCGTPSGGSTGLSTSSPWTIGQLAYVVSNGAVSSVATGTISASGPLSVTAGRSAIGGAAAFSITQAGAGSDGYLSQTDFNTFNNKISSTSLSVTTVGTSGAATYTPSTGVFNIPNYTSTPTTPGGASSTIQYNANGAFAGNTGLTYDGTNLDIVGTARVRSIFYPSKIVAGLPAIDSAIVSFGDYSSGHILTMNAAGTKGITIDNSGTYPTIHTDYFSGSDPRLHLSTYTNKNDGNGLFILNGGNVGIGSTTPFFKLSVGTGNVGTFGISTSTAGCAQFSAFGELYSTGTNCGAAGNYITALTGDVTATGPGSVAATLATVNSNVGTFTNATVTANGKGLITAISSGATPEVPLTFSSGLTRSVNNVTCDIANSTTKGCLTATDFGLFNNKISSTSLSGTSVISYTSGTGVITTTGGTFGAGNYVFPTDLTVTGNATTTAFFASVASTSLLFGSNLQPCTGTNALTWTGGLFGCAPQPQGTVTSVTGTTNQISSTGGATPALSFPSLVIFPSNASSTLFSTTYGSTTLGYFGQLFLPSKGTPAGSFAAFDANGQLISTTSPSGGGTITLSGDVSGSGTTAITTTIGALKVLGSMIANATIDLTTKVTGILPIANGGTNNSSFTNNALTYFDGTKLASMAGALWNSVTSVLTVPNLTVTGIATTTGGCIGCTDITISPGINLLNAQYGNATSTSLTANTLQDIYTAPAGRRVMLTGNIFRNASAGTVVVSMYLKTGGVYYQLSASTSVNTKTSSAVSSPYILEPGETISVLSNTTVSNFNIWADFITYSAATPTKSVKVISPSSATSTLYTTPVGMSAIIWSFSAPVILSNTAAIFTSNATPSVILGKIFIIKTGQVASDDVNGLIQNTNFSTGNTVSSAAMGGTASSPGIYLNSGEVIQYWINNPTTLMWVNVSEH